MVIYVSVLLFSISKQKNKETIGVKITASLMKIKERSIKKGSNRTPVAERVKIKTTGFFVAIIKKIQISNWRTNLGFSPSASSPELSAKYNINLLYSNIVSKINNKIPNAITENIKTIEIFSLLEKPNELCNFFDLKKSDMKSINIGARIVIWPIEGKI